MCNDCLIKDDARSALPPTQEMCELAEMVNRLYSLDGCAVGGPLHILVDDFNVDDDSINWLKVHFEELGNYEPKVLTLSSEILAEMHKLTTAQRSCVLGFAHGYLGLADIK